MRRGDVTDGDRKCRRHIKGKATKKNKDPNSASPLMKLL